MAGISTVALHGDGNRVEKTVAGSVTLYFVDNLNPTGYAQVLAEETANTSVNVSYAWGLDFGSSDGFSISGSGVSVLSARHQSRALRPLFASISDIP